MEYTDDIVVTSRSLEDVGEAFSDFYKKSISCGTERAELKNDGF